MEGKSRPGVQIERKIRVKGENVSFLYFIKVSIFPEKSRLEKGRILFPYPSRLPQLLEYLKLLDELLSKWTSQASLLPLLFV